MNDFRDAVISLLLAFVAGCAQGGGARYHQRSHEDAGSGQDAQPIADAGADAPRSVDSGLRDAGHDAGTDSGPAPVLSHCSDKHNGALFCDGFESTTLSPWHINDHRGTVQRTSQNVYLGEGSLRAFSDGLHGLAYTDTNTAWRIDSGDLYLRAYLWVPAGGTYTSLTVLHLHPDIHSEGLRFGVRKDGKTYLRIAKANTGIYPSYLMPTERWACVEVHVNISASGSAEYWIDGALIGNKSGIDTKPTGGFVEGRAGLTWSDSQQPPAEIRVDEFVVSRTRVGCD